MSVLKKFFASFAMMFMVLGMVSAPVSVSAQLLPDTCPPAGCPVTGNQNFENVDRTRIADFIINIARAFTYIIGALAVLFLVYGGFLFVTDSGDGKRADNGKKIVFNALIGLVIAVIAFTLVQVVGGLIQGNLLEGI